MLLLGAALFALYAPATAAGPPGTTAVLPRALTLGAALLLLAAAVAWLAENAVALDDPGDPRPVAAVARTLVLETGIGRAWAAQIVLAALLLAAVLARAPAGVVLLPAAGALASQAWIGHAAAGTGAEGAVRLGSMAVHLLAAGAWLGGLVPLGRTLRAARLAGGEAALAGAARALRRFSRMGYAAVGLILLTGVANTWFVAATARGFALAYASALALKLVLAAALVSLALANRTVLLPRVDGAEGRDPAALAALERNVLLEQGLGLLVVLTASLLGSLPPSPA
jgi:putative copper resistance protein D